MAEEICAWIKTSVEGNIKISSNNEKNKLHKGL